MENKKKIFVIFGILVILVITVWIIWINLIIWIWRVRIVIRS